MKEKFVGFLVVAGLLTACSNQQISSSKVPSVVLNAISEQYPAKDDVEWKKLGNLYEAEIDLNDSVDVTVQVTEAGQVMLQKQDIATAELPASVLSSIQAQYADYTIDEVEKVTKGSTVYYQLELEASGKKDKKLVLLADGKEDSSTAFWD
ncbi:PepSY-like domain-containing protein [Flavisolibacter sp. BT320]|nr:PepSY-like domain-containing protein [Flavisolibacter longurius]